MTNMEYYREQIEKILGANSRLAAGVINKELCNCNSLNCCDCLFEARKGTCENNKLRWLMAEHKEEPTLTTNEAGIANLLSGGYIAREESGKLYWYEYAPVKGESDGVWKVIDGSYSPIYRVFIPIFEFIHWDDAEPWSVEDLRKLKVRENND